MVSAYAIILVLFFIAGALTAGWGFKAYRRSQKRAAWPSVRGEISQCQLQSPDDPMLPLIEYRYQVNGQSFTSRLQFPSATSPSEELSKSYVARFPMSAAVDVYYQTDQPAHSTLEPKSQGDWFLMAIGLATMVLAVVLLLAPAI